MQRKLSFTWGGRDSLVIKAVLLTLCGNERQKRRSVGPKRTAVRVYAEQAFHLPSDRRNI